MLKKVLSLFILGVVLFLFGFSSFWMPKEIDSNIAPDSFISFSLDGVEIVSIPTKESGARVKNIHCNHSAIASWDYDSWGIRIRNLSQTRTKCQVEFVSTYSLSQAVLAQDGGIEEIKKKGTPDFRQKGVTDEGIYMYHDLDGETFYYRGAVLDNYVYFADYYWRIVRINGDGSIRLIYQGKTPDATLKDSIIGLSALTSSATKDISYANYMYGVIPSNSIEEANSNRYSSDVKKINDSWYQENLLSYEDYLADAVFCGDRRIYSGSGFGSTDYTVYQGYERSQITFIPDLSCEKNDSFTVKENKGNGALTYPIGLLSIDEAMLAGGVIYQIDVDNQDFYLYSHYNFWLMTPFRNNNVDTNAYNVNTTGNLGGQYALYSGGGVRPVINLKSTAVFYEGDGSKNNPFRIV